MPVQDTKKIGGRPVVNQPVSKLDTLHDTWRVMRPFVHFSVAAMKVIAHTLIFIVKSIPKPGEHDDKTKNDKVIKI